ncbi:MAG TPA: L-seryl-tRNA(Sec) selenium transferase [Gemmatimonadales bacterium]
MSDVRRGLPAVSRLLGAARDRGLDTRWSRADLVEAIRAVVGTARTAGVPPDMDWVGAVDAWLLARNQRSLRPVINATGVVLHTNLGRAPLADVARDAVARALGYSTLELNPDTGERGRRQSHVQQLLQELTGGSAALVVNNAASALLLVLNALADGGETIVSRGELVEIGGAFRIPEIMAKSGSVLIEVGTTNRTRATDYLAAVSPRTRLLLKVHRSNFQQRGFVSETSVEELLALGAERGLPVAHDVGSGLLVNLERFGLTGEPPVTRSAKAGAVVIFSGDKLLGGPQAGLVVGPTDIVEKIARNPLARALRPDKITFAALEATLRLYREPELALRDIPVLRMLTADPVALRRRARRLARRIPESHVEAGESVVGGGAFPDCELPTTLVVIDVPSAEQLLAALRRHDPPVIARAVDGGVALDVRTIADEEFGAVASAVAGARRSGEPGNIGTL